MKFKDLTGLRFGRLFVVSVHSRPFRTTWDCLCDCGNRTVVLGGNLRSGYTQSCGCLRRDVGREVNLKHGATHTPEYRIWTHMIGRCTNPNDSRYPDYGGRGITVCDRWRHSFENFIADIGKRPTKHHSIERKNNDLGYEPGNCKWATRREQMRNTRRAMRLTILGETKSLSDWCDHYNQSYRLAKKRIQYLGWDVIEALTIGPR